MELKEIRSLVDLMKKNGIAVFKLERDNFKISLKTNEGAMRVVQLPPFAPAPHSHLIPGEPGESPQAIHPHGPHAAVTISPDSSIREICSPMVGTFYASPAPDAPAFVEVGQTVGPDTVVCIIEAMKVMNEIKAELSGTVVEVCAENGKPVQFGQPLFRVK